jgi:hypothetical protein
MMILLFGFVPIIFNASFKLLGRLALRVLPSFGMPPTQDFLNGMYEGYPWLPHYVLSSVSFVVLVGTALSTARSGGSSARPHDLGMQPATHVPCRPTVCVCFLTL